MKRIVLFLFASFFLFGCTLPPFLSPTPDTANPDCSNIAITDADVDATLEYGKSLLSQGDWKRTYTVATDQVYASYISNELSAVVHVDTLALCNAPVALKPYANQETLTAILSNYDSYLSVASCEKNGALLFQFTALDQGTNYNISLWYALLKNPNRALEVMLVFQQTDPERMAAFAEYFFPNLITCQ
jgi:hypothetical protein